MKNYNTLFIGIDVDDKAFHIGAVVERNKEIFQTKCKPTFGALIKKLEQYEEKGFTLKICYEASYIGYGLCRYLRATDYECEIIAPSLIPQVKGRKIKTDKIDALNLAKYFLRGDLTPITVPDKEDEEVRTIIRSRSFFVKERANFKRNVISLCRLEGINYKEEKTESSKYWTHEHKDWLNRKIKELSENLQKVFNNLLGMIESFDQSIKVYELQIEKLSHLERYRKKVKALNCFRGIDTLSSMSLVVEIGDIRRFSHPNKLTSYCGLDIIEYSSGGKESKYGITKMGNKNIRTVLVESCQGARAPFRISKRLKKSREGQEEPKVLEIADKCMKRLCKKGNHLLNVNKPLNKIKVAMARELGGFVWAVLREVS